jgi:hypothetical protein
MALDLLYTLQIHNAWADSLNDQSILLMNRIGMINADPSLKAGIFLLDLLVTVSRTTHPHPDFFCVLWRKLQCDAQMKTKHLLVDKQTEVNELFKDH